MRSPGAADYTSEFGAAAAAPAPNRIQEVATAASRQRRRVGPIAGRSVDQRRWEISQKNSLKRRLEKEIGEAPPSRLEQVGLLAERVARLRLKVMEWFSQKTSIAGVQIPNWGIVLGAVVVIFLIYSSMH